MWGDSDIPYLHQITESICMKKAMLRGMYLSKIAAKIIESEQLLGLGKFLRFRK